MPPKIKTDRDAIIRAAFGVAKEAGVGAITAQSVSAALQTSVAPIFREFPTMEDLRRATVETITAFHTQYIQSYPLADSPFLTYGLAYIHFAKAYPYLFETIMQPCRDTVNERLSGPLAFAVECAGRESGLGKEQAQDFFFNIWVYTHGLACLLYKGSLDMTAQEERTLLMTAFAAFSAQYQPTRLEDTP